MGKYNFSFFQIPSSGPVEDGAAGDQAHRNTDAKVSNFGALNYGNRDAGDYTKTQLGFKAKDDLQNPDIPDFLPTGNSNFANAVNNPYQANSTVFKTRHDEFMVMTLGSRQAVSATQPLFDAMDSKVVWDTTISGVTGTTVSGVILNFPTEGWKTFGGRTGGPFGV